MRLCYSLVVPDIHANMLLQGASVAIEALRQYTDVHPLEQQLLRLKAAPKKWNESRPCVYPGCTENSIRRSHTIQDAALARAFGPEAMTPKWSEQAGGFDIVASAVKGLSVFPGYCTMHEKRFPFEERGSFEDDRDDALQLMRTCHREIWLAENRRKYADELMGLWEDIRAADVRGTVPSLRIGPSATTRAEALRDHSTLQSTMIVRLRPLAKRLEDAVGERKSMPATGLHAIDLDRKPFTFHAAVQTDPENASLLLITLVPNGDRSRLLVAIEPGFEPELVTYVAQWLQRSQVDRTLDAWIRHGTLDWYADPVWWTGLTVVERKSLLDAVNTFGP